MSKKKTEKQKWLGKVRWVFNRYIRLRDAVRGLEGLCGKCISCGATWLLMSPDDWKKYQAGHYWREDKYESVRFDERNVNGQCFRCNRYMSGNLAEYAEGLKKKIGARAFNALNIKRNKVHSHTVVELERAYRIYKKLLENKEAELGL